MCLVVVHPTCTSPPPLPLHETTAAAAAAAAPQFIEYVPLRSHNWTAQKTVDEFGSVRFGSAVPQSPCFRSRSQQQRQQQQQQQQQRVQTKTTPTVARLPTKQNKTKQKSTAKIPSQGSVCFFVPHHATFSAHTSFQPPKSHQRQWNHTNAYARLLRSSRILSDDTIVLASTTPPPLESRPSFSQSFLWLFFRHRHPT